MNESPDAGAPESIDPVLRARLDALMEEGRDIFERFDLEVRQHQWHPFVPADYEKVLAALLPLRSPGARFLEWGSATGVITIMADMLGFEAYGIEIDRDLVEIARGLAQRFDSGARFAAGSYLPQGYVWRDPTGDTRLATIGIGESGYLDLKRPLEDFDLIFAYPWHGEEPVVHDVMRTYGRRDAKLLVNRGREGFQLFQNGRVIG
jgi:hypothetical protein